MSLFACVSIALALPRIFAVIKKNAKHTKKTQIKPNKKKNNTQDCVIILNFSRELAASFSIRPQKEGGV